MPTTCTGMVGVRVFRLCRDMTAPMETMVDDAPGSTLYDNGIEDGAKLYLYAVQPGADGN